MDETLRPRDHRSDGRGLQETCETSEHSEKKISTYMRKPHLPQMAIDRIKIGIMISGLRLQVRWAGLALPSLHKTRRSMIIGASCGKGDFTSNSSSYARCWSGVMSSHSPIFLLNMSRMNCNSAGPKWYVPSEGIVSDGNLFHRASTYRFRGRYGQAMTH